MLLVNSAMVSLCNVATGCVATPGAPLPAPLGAPPFDAAPLDPVPFGEPFGPAPPGPCVPEDVCPIEPTHAAAIRQETATVAVVTALIEDRRAMMPSAGRDTTLRLVSWPAKRCR